MGLIETLLIAVGLAMDAAAVSMSAGGSGLARGKRASFRLSFHFGLFQFMMPVIGWFGGIQLVSYVAPVDHWIAFALLGFVGVRMIHAGLHPDSERPRDDPSKGLSLVMLSVATSIDALAVGLSLAMLEVSIWYPSVTIGIVTALLSLVGLRIGRVFGAKLGARMEIVGGVILFVIGARILVMHLVQGT
jgi:putative Mn2+ efflux pump MntP